MCIIFFIYLLASWAEISPLVTSFNIEYWLGKPYTPLFLVTEVLLLLFESRTTEFFVVLIDLNSITEEFLVKLRFFLIFNIILAAEVVFCPEEVEIAGNFIFEDLLFILLNLESDYFDIFAVDVVTLP